MFYGLLCTKSKPEKLKIGIINATQVLEGTYSSFKLGMEKFGYIEGKNITYLYEGPGENISSINQRGQSVIKKNVDCIVTFGNQACMTAAKLTKENHIPVIFAISSRPVELGMVKAYQVPGGNITGVHLSGFTSKTFHWMHRTLPYIKNLYVPHNPKDRSSVQMVDELKKCAAPVSIKLIICETTNSTEMHEAAINIPDSADAIYMLSFELSARFQKEFCNNSLKHKIPLIFSQYDSVDKGALLGFGIDFTKCGLQAAQFTHKVISGADPASLPMEGADFFLGINLKTAKMLNIKISDVVINRADKIIR